MELYNFFTEVVSEKENDKLKELKSCINELKPRCTHVKLVLWTGLTGEKRYSIVGQIYGDDTNIGDLNLVWIFKNIKYTWFESMCPENNNLKQ